jgi:hypothetical protein
MDVAEGNSPTPVANAPLAPLAQPMPGGSTTDLAALIVASVQQAVQAALQPIQNQLDNLQNNQEYLHTKTDGDNKWGQSAENPIQEWYDSNHQDYHYDAHNNRVPGPRQPTEAKQSQWEQPGTSMPMPSCREETMMESWNMSQTSR